MRTRHTGKNRTRLLLAILALLVAFGYITYRWTLARQTGPGAYALAKSAYEKSVTAYAANDLTGAITQLDEAGKLTDKAIASIDLKKTLSGKPAEERANLLGELSWLKARILRDRAFAQAAQEGKPIPETLDSSTGEKYRAYTAIPDLAARSAAIAMVRQAVERIFDNAELTRDALRIELVLQPMQWNRIEKLCMMSLKSDPKDSRALYFLAKYEFDQPGSDGEAGSLTYENRDPMRIARAKEYMAAARAAGSPYWRSVHLEAEILNWLSRDARKRDPVRANAYQDELRALILGQPNGAFEKAKRGEQWTNLSGHDIRAIAAIPAFAVELAADDLAQMRTVVRDSLSIFDRLAKISTSASNLADAGEGTIDTMAIAGSALARQDPSGWAALLEEAEALFSKNPLGLGRPKAAMKFAKLYAQMPGAKESSRAADPRMKALLVHAISASNELRTPPAKQLELRAAMIDTLALNDTPTTEIEAQLAVLRPLDEPRAKAILQFHEAVLAGRAGLAQAARKKLEPLVDNKAAPDITSRAMAVLANLAFDSEDYNSALGYLREVEAAFAKLDQYSPWDAAWLKRDAGSADEVALRQVMAIYELGRARVAHWQRGNPGKIAPEEIRQSTEQTANPYSRRLPPASETDRLARQARIRFLAAAGQSVLAEKQLALLAVDYPNNAEVLRLSAAVFAAPKPGEFEPDAAGIAKIDTLLADFLQANPNSVGAKAFKLEWLLNTNRRTDAMQYLQSPANNAKWHDALLEAAVSGTLFGTDGLDDVSTILAALPVEPGVASTIISGSMPTGVETLSFRRTAAERKLQVVNAWRQFLEGKYESAAEGFLAVMDIAALKPTARAGLARCLLQYADAENTKAGVFLGKLQARYPDEPSIFLAAALVALRNEDVGEQFDVWGNSKSMWAALKKWELIAHAYGIPQPVAAAMKMRFLLLAGRLEMAQQLTRQYSKSIPDEPALLRIMCELHLGGPYRDLEAAKKDLAKAFAVIPDDAIHFHRLEARLFVETGDLDSARKVCELAVQNNPYSGAAFAQLIEVATAQKDSAAAMQIAFRWQALQSTNPKALAALVAQLYLNKLEPAAKQFAEKYSDYARHQGETFSLAAMFDIAEAFLGLDDAEMEGYLRAALKRDPASARGQYLAGMLSERRKEWDNALKHYEAALKVKPRDFVSATRMMRILAVEKQDPAAAFALGMKVRTIPESNRLIPPERLPAEFLQQWGNAARFSIDRERLAEARDCLLIGVRDHPGDPRLLVTLAELQTALGEGARAAENLAEALRLEKVAAARKKIRE
jgi:hypothetical protein